MQIAAGQIGRYEVGSEGIGSLAGCGGSGSFATPNPGNSEPPVRRRIRARRTTGVGLRTALGSVKGTAIQSNLPAGREVAQVEIRDLRKSYGDAVVIKGIDVEFEDGSFVILVGPSGCGKSTLLRIIAGLEEQSSGVVLIDGEDVTHQLPKDRDIAMVFQNYGLYPHMTAAQNMGFALKLKRVDRAEIDRSVRRAARILNLEALLDRYPRQLSGGQRQRVAMGRAIVRNPTVFLFDEPLSNLDAKLRVQMRAEIRKLHQQLNVTTVYVTHDQIEAMTMADMIVTMRDGMVMQVGTPLELYDRPQNLFVAGFIGSPAMNFFETVADEDGLRLPGAGIVAASPVAPGRRVTLGVRPEDLVLADEGLGATVGLVEHTGSEILVGARLDEAESAQEVTLMLRDRIDIRIGQPVHIALKPGRSHLFDPETEARLDPD